MTLTYDTDVAISSLRPGPNGLPRNQVLAIQKGRMVAATVEAVEEFGYTRLTVAAVVTRARVSRKTFYDVFADSEDCFLAAFELALSRARLLASQAYEHESGWRNGIRAALASLLVFMEEEPGLAMLCIVEAPAAGDRVLERRAEVLGELAEIIDRGRAFSNANHQPPAVTAEGVVGGILSVVHARALADGTASLTKLHGALMSMIVLPYLGARAAGSELRRAPLRVRSVKRSRPSVRPTDPLEGLNMRLTYRTVRVLVVIAKYPGASNREIAEGSGVNDQGQISKLMTRLARLNLVENRGEGQEKGAANAWYLTARGAQVERATRPR